MIASLGNLHGVVVAQGGTLKVALIWAQFAAYHVDRCEAAARRLAGRADVLAIEVASKSQTYAWGPSADVAGARKLTLFPDRDYETIPAATRIAAIWRAVRHCDWVFIGTSYAEADAIVLSTLLKLAGVKVVVFSESKYDDRPRRKLVEWTKRAVLGRYHGAIVGGPRHLDYFRGLGFRRRPLLPGYDGVSVDRVRAEAGGVLAPNGAPFAERPFVFVGRFVDKKNLPGLLEGYALYAAKAGAAARHLVLTGSGVEEAMLRASAQRLGIADKIEFPGFLPASRISQLLAGALALVLVSIEEQWGLVVNEALALGLPAVVSREVGSRDLLVGHGQNGFVVDSGSPSEIAEALAGVAESEDRWREMVAVSHARSWFGDTERFADAIEAMIGPVDAECRARIERMRQAPA